MDDLKSNTSPVYFRQLCSTRLILTSPSMPDSKFVILLFSLLLPHTEGSYQTLMPPVFSVCSISAFMFSIPNAPKEPPLSTQKFLSRHLLSVIFWAFLALNVNVVIGSTLVFRPRRIMFDAGICVAPLYSSRGYPR